MADIARIKAVIGADDKEFKSKLKQAGKSIGFFQQQVQKFGAALATYFSIRAIVNFTKSAAAAYDVQQKAERSFLVALGNREDIQKRIIQQAQDLQKITLFGDEETIRAANRLATLLGAEEESIKKLLPLIQDFATAKEMDLTMAAELVAKSVGSSTNALSRYGIQIEGTVGSSERLESAVSALTEQFKGQAKAAAEEGTAGMKQLQNAWGDFKEGLIGTTGALNGFFKRLKSELEVTTEFLNNDYIPAWQRLWGIFDSGIAKVNSQIVKLTKEFDEELTSMLEQGQFSVEKYTERYKEIYVKRGKDIANLYRKIAVDLVQSFKRSQAAISKETETITEQLGKIPTLQKKIKELNEVKEKTWSNDKIARINDEIKALEKQLKVLDDLTLQTNELSRATGELQEEVTKGIPQKMEKPMQEISEFVQLTERSMENLVVAFGKAAGELIAGTGNIENFFASIMNVVGEYAINMGTLLIAQGVAMEAFKTSLEDLEGWGAIAAGAALVAVGAAISGLASNMANTSLTGGGSVGGAGYANTSQNMQPQTIKLEAIIKGRDIYLTNQRHGELLLNNT